MRNSRLTVAAVLIFLLSGCTSQYHWTDPNTFIVVPDADDSAPTADMLVNDNFKVNVEVTPTAQPITIYAGSGVISVIGSATDNNGGIKNVKLFSTLEHSPFGSGGVPFVNGENQSNTPVGGSTLKRRPIAQNFDLKSLLGPGERIRLTVWVEGVNFFGKTVTTAKVSDVQRS